MSLSRLENFLKSSRGKILHVNPEDLNSSDAITNEGSSPFTPFKTINRALIEAARYSYQIGLENDRFNFCTILLHPGEHFVDNRPGLVIEDDGTSYVRNGTLTSLTQFDINTVLDLSDPTNSLYLLNSIHGGVIVPRGTSIVAQDLRKTVVRPLYVPDPTNENIERSAIFRITGASFFFSFSILDANPGGFCYKNYNPVKYTPNFSHHKLTAFEYVDGVNDVSVSDTFLTLSTTRTDLDQYYEKISIVYGASSDRPIDTVNYVGGVSVDIQPVIDEFRIVGPRGEVVGISSIISGNGITPSEIITVTLDGTVDGISVDTSVQVTGVNQSGYDGQFVVSAVPSENQIQYITPDVPTISSPSTFGATLNIISDTISSASPYIFNCSLRSVYGMCGLHADGSKVGGFKSVVVAQFTAVSLQKDDNAFVIYDEESGTYLDSTTVPDLYKNTRARYKPEFENYHIKISNDSFAQLVSVFSIGYATQIVAESGGDYSITNSNSNFGAKTFVSSGYKKETFDQDDHGYIVGIIPPEEIPEQYVGIEFPQIDVGITTSIAVSAATTSRLYFHDKNDIDSPPTSFVDGFRIGSKVNERLYIEYPTETSSKVVIPNTDSSFEKTSVVQRQNNNFENSITAGVFTLTSTHTFLASEKVRVFSENGHLPDGVNHDQVYYIIDSTIDNTLTNSQIKLAESFNDSINDIPILPNKKGGKLTIASRVSDKVPNDPGHPIQWDSTNNNWYITVDPTDNGIYDAVLGTNSIVTGRTYILRTPDNRVEENKLYKLLYCIPKNTTTSARPPVNGFIIQESNDNSLSGTEFSRYFTSTDLASETEIRNPKFISNVSWSSSQVTVTTELPHKFNVGDLVELVKVTPSGYNGTYTITNIPNSRQFVYTLSTNPGTFSNDTRVRDLNLPYVKRKNTNNVFQVYKSEEIQKYIQNKQDGVYELTVVHNSVSPTIDPFTGINFSQPVKNLYPKLDRDNPDSDPDQTECFVDHNIIGNVFVNDPQNSISKEAFNKLSYDFSVGFGITGIISTESGLAHTIFTGVDHNLSGITSVSIVSTGASYVAGTYYGVGITTTSGGEAASFKVVVDGSQKITSIDVMSGGSNYTPGNIVSVTSGIGTTTGFVPATLSVVSVNNPVDAAISIYGFSGEYYEYNDTYRLSSINGSKQLTLESTSTISSASTTLVSGNAFGVVNGEIISISSLVYNNFSGISTITTLESHGLKENIKVRISGFTSDFYNSDVNVVSVNSVTEFEVDHGKSSSILATTGSGVVIPLGIKPIIGNSRIEYYYSGITTTTGTILNVDDPEGTPFNIRNVDGIGLKKGDYIEVNGEIMRIKSESTADFVEVYRSQFGTDKKTHPVGTVVRKINIIPVELRRNSIIRASGHTFEYVGYGPGNYSTALPENQDREIDKIERLISQSTKLSGGTVYYTGMDENGDFYSANKKLSSSTGEEEIYDLPAPTVVGETTIDESQNIIDSQKVIISDSLKVDGGRDNNSVSIFNGPIVINKKLTSYSKEGVEVSSLFLKGDQNVSRRYSISTDTPSVAGNYGDIIYRASPNEGENIGWVYTTSDRWKTWGYVGDLGTLIYIYSGDESGTTTLEGVVDKLKFVGDSNGFGIDVDIQIDPTVGFGTIVLRNPIDVVNFGTDILGKGLPTFTSRSLGSRVVYENSLTFNAVDYSSGIDTGIYWQSIPQNTADYTFRWYGGETQLMSLSGEGNLNIEGIISGTFSGSLNGNSNTSTTAFNLSRSVIAGIGLTGGGLLDGQDVTLSVGQGDGITVGVSSISVDATVVRTTGNQSISGTKTFTGNINSSNINSSGIVTANTFDGGGIIPIGGIIMWSGAVNNVPNKWALCMTGDSEVLLSDGSKKRIDEIVDNRLPVEVMSFNEKTGLTEPRRVVDWFVNESNKNEYIRLKIFRGNSKLDQKRSLDVTRDHPVWVVDKGWVTADKIKSGDKVLIHQPTLTNAGHQSILGQWLGDGSIDEMGVFRLSHGKSQEEYISDTTKKLGINLKEHVQTGNGYGTGKKYLRTCLALKTFSPDTYELMMSGRKARKEVLRELGPIGLAYWYMDDGNLQVDVRSATPTVRAQIHTEGFTEDELQLIIEWFNSSYGINVIPYNRPNTKGKFIRFDYKSTIKFLELIAPYIHPSMRYKLPENLHSIPYLLENTSFIENKPTEQYVSVVEICNLSPSKKNNSRFHKRYDIKVEGLHSFIANGFIVHNCNGLNGTPDLRDRFIVGAGNDYSPGGTGGANSVSLTVAQLPAHGHTGTTDRDGGHTHSGTTSTIGNHSHSIPDYPTNRYSTGGNTALDRTGATTGSTGEAGSHNHTFTTDTAGGHTHTFTTNNTGSGNAHENRPPYYALAFIMRVS